MTIVEYVNNIKAYENLVLNHVCDLFTDADHFWVNLERKVTSFGILAL